MTRPDDLPERVAPRRQAAVGGEIRGSIALSALSRVAACLYMDKVPGDGLVQVQLSFSEDSQRQVVIVGKLHTELVLQCQHCLQPLVWPLDVVLNLQVVADEDAALHVSRDREFVIATAGELDLKKLIEDELILAAPLVARCDADSCRRQEDHSQADEQLAKYNPLTVLRQLQRR